MNGQAIPLHPALSRLNDPTLFRQAALIDGAWVSAAARVDVSDPASQTTLGFVPDISADQTEEAIDAADRAFALWCKSPVAERASLLMRWHDLMLENADDLALILTAEQGKPLAEARGEIGYGASFVKWFAEEATRIEGQLISAPAGDRQIVVMKDPVGVCAIVTPWNFPVAMITRKVAPALAAGCTVLIKPSEFTPYSALALGELALRAGIPAGVVNVLTGLPTDIGGVLTASPVVRKLSFTGSTRVGSLLMAQCAPTVKRLSLELGGNAPFIVFDDADVDAAVEGAMASKFRNGGQTCVCANRLFVQSGIYDIFAAKLSEVVAALKVGPGLDNGVDIGPMINQAATDKISRHIEDAVAKGAKVAAQALAPGGPQFAAPVVLTDVTPDMVLAQEETFGPVAPLFRFETEEEAVALANDTPYGLAAYFYTESHRRAWRVGQALEAGLVGLNTGNMAMAAAPFGGVKQSGLGREGSRAGIEEYLEIKAFHMAG
ncbi:MAG: NAD-dependent succinate-semialdehyde dehydrogenase [bacterium]|nr:NAD-dependent succinate-semialdehyde dehydrogenase [bacterium]